MNRQCPKCFYFHAEEQPCRSGGAPSLFDEGPDPAKRFGDRDLAEEEPEAGGPRSSAEEVATSADEPYPSGPPDPRDLREGERLRDEGIRRTLTQEEAVREWTQAFERVLAALLGEGRTQVTSEDVLLHVGLPPGSRNRIGAVMRGCAVKYGLRNVGTIKSSRVKRHAGRITVWEKI